MSEKVLITGASGFIGSFLVEEALRHGFDVFAGVRKTSSREYLRDERIHILEPDLSSPEQLEKQLMEWRGVFGPFDYVIHNAGLTQARTRQEFLTVNYEYTRNLVNALQATRQPLSKFILISSLATYGPGEASTFQPIRDSDPQRPVSLYGESKRLGEQVLRSCTQFPHLIIQPTAVYGPRDRDFFQLVKLVNKGFEVSIGSHQQMTSLIYVKDLTRAVVNSLTAPVLNRSFILSDGCHYEKVQLGAAIQAALGGKTLKITLPLGVVKGVVWCVEKVYAFFGHRPFLNSEKLAEISGANWLCQGEEIWNHLRSEPDYDLEKGILETVAWYQENGWLPRKQHADFTNG